MKNISKILISLLIIFILGLSIYLIRLEQRLYQFASIYDSEYSSNQNIIITETGVISQSQNSTYWLNSGALYYLNGNNGHTILGDLPKYSSWRIVYQKTNPIDSDEGYHPQNIFRLITKEMGSNFSQSLYALIIKDNLSSSPNRNESNGILLINRYLDSNNLYYSGIRVDGSAVIKKKINGVYHTLAQTTIFSGDPYNKNINPNLLPKNKWVGIRVDVKNSDEKNVEIKLFLDLENTGAWTKVLSVIDSKQDSNNQILGKGHNGIRTDFMDIEFKNYLYEKI